jgi:hypothetical protein
VRVILTNPRYTFALGGHRPDLIRAARPSRHIYQLSSGIFCVPCDQRMTGSRNYYQCWNSATHAEAVRPDHPTVLYVRKDKLIEPADEWIVRIFEPSRYAATVRALQESQTSELDHAAISAARAAITASKTRIERYRAALDAGTDPIIVNGWISEVTAARAAAGHQLKQLIAKRYSQRQASKR